jgi:hypothetical protein
MALKKKGTPERLKIICDRHKKVVNSKLECSECLKELKVKK